MSKRIKLNTIRIIAGRWRGRRLTVPDIQGLRPTTDRVRETVFNWLAPDIGGARCLDLFSGTGALGLESCSRGASFVELVESDVHAFDGLQAGVAALVDDPAQSPISVVLANSLDHLSTPPEKRFDIVFLDPPFASALLAPAIDLLVQKNWLSGNAKVYIEQAAAHSKLRLPESWSLYRHGKAGQSAFYLYQTP